jgi:hypothetical protein
MASGPSLDEIPLYGPTRRYPLLRALPEIIYAYDVKTVFDFVVGRAYGP